MGDVIVTGYHDGGYYTEDLHISVYYSTEDSGGTWPGAFALGNNWWWLNWLGYYSVTNTSWIYHKELGRLYTTEGSENSQWFWSSNAQLGWFWTTKNLYPSIYNQSQGSWLWYQKNVDRSQGPASFYNWNTLQWLSLPLP